MNSIIITLITLFAVLILGMSFVRYKLAFVLYLSYLILVPYLKIGPISFTLLNVLLFGAFIFDFKIRHNISLDFRIIRPFLFLLVSLLLITLCADMVSPSFQLNAWGNCFNKTCILSFIIWNVSIYDEQFIKNAKWSLIISILIAGVYAILIMKLNGSNPYTSFLTDHFVSNSNIVDTAEDYAGSPRPRNQGTMAHPFVWVFYLSAFCPFFLTLFLKERKPVYLLLLSFVAFNIIISNVRTGIVCASVALTYIYIRNSKNIYNMLFYGTAIVAIAAFIVSSNEKLSELFLSLIDFSGTKTNVDGSSFQMRIDQFNGCLDEISDNWLFGNGYGWASYYLSKTDFHPVILGFESLIYTVLCDHGIAGVVIWSIFAFMLFQTPRKILGIKKNVYCIDGLVVFFFTYTIATGLHGYLPSFALFYSLLLAYLYNEEKREIEIL